MSTIKNDNYSKKKHSDEFVSKENREITNSESDFREAEDIYNQAEPSKAQTDVDYKPKEKKEDSI